MILCLEELNISQEGTLMRMDYLALANGLDSRELIPSTSNITSIIKQNPRQDIYTSLFTYQDRHLEHFKKTRSLKGITDVKTNRLFFDFDDKMAPQKAQYDTIELCNRLIESGIPKDKIQIYFSGNKGFHIGVALSESLTRQEFVNVVFDLASGLATFDVRINDEARIIRAPFSIHQDSGLHKIPLAY